MSGKMDYSIALVYVIYNPDYILLERSIFSIKDQVSAVVIVDNSLITSNHEKEIKKMLERILNVEYISLGQNNGIALAQNIGIKRSMQYEYIMLSDQDTIYPTNYVKKILSSINNQNYRKIAALAPDFSEINRGGQRQGFVIFRGVFSRKIKPRSGCVSISHAIASGLVVCTKALGEIGLMNEDYFIDWVDLEWCWRAISKGYIILGCADVVISHNLGDRAVRVGKTHYPVRSHIRHYYIIRNAIYIGLHDNGIKLSIRVNVLSKMLKYLIGFTLLGKPHSLNIAYCLRGIRHGALKRLGPISVRK